MKPGRLFLVFLISAAELWVAQRRENVAYEQIRSQFARMQPGDTAALPYVDLLIALARRENNAAELFSAYHDAVIYNRSEHLKLKYADSAIVSAHRSCRDDLIAKAYLGRGIVCYFNFKAYQPALDSYLKARPYAEKTDDAYLQHKLLYHLGAVKSYLGAYREAACHFEASAAFFRQQMQKDQHPNLLHDMRKGYYNSLHQLINCYQQLGEDHSAERYIAEGEKHTPRDRDFRQLRAYFFKCRGIAEYRRSDWKKSTASLKSALPELIRVNDFSWVSVIYFYLGKNSLAQHRRQEALTFFKKVDSVYQNRRFFFPELTENYSLLLQNARQKADAEQVLYYSEALRETEAIKKEDGHHLAARFDTDRMTIEHSRVTQRYRNILTGLVMVTVVLFFFPMNAFLERIAQKEMEAVFAGGAVPDPVSLPVAQPSKWTPSADLREKIRTNLQRFEEEQAFLQHNLTVEKVARRINTNKNYLSSYINREKGINFSRYLAELRISYIAALLSQDRSYLNYSAEALAHECGIAARSNFVKLFEKIYGMPLQKYIQQCRTAFAEAEKRDGGREDSD